jgi:hypothetical protein
VTPWQTASGDLRREGLGGFPEVSLEDICRSKASTTRRPCDWQSLSATFSREDRQKLNFGEIIDD